ncbi:DUF6173 family protein [Pelosinus sp. Bkl1]|uniref:DUF6173 family protein n=2 Tax=Pelosinus baikalensis TaxID=2892015 RepID=A0ABS8I160_9FIRM|nr:DUF6173 family protein [Pelosinus baikalensis]
MEKTFHLANVLNNTPENLSPQETKSLIRDYHHADWMCERIIGTINDFEAELPDDMQAGGRLVSFGQTVQFSINDVSYWNPDMIVFYGTLPTGEPVRLVQHSSQLSLLLVALKRSNPKEPRRKIGFHSEDQSEQTDD